ncbi:unnamed protein product, partial [Amoebophrya sp. A25]
RSKKVPKFLQEKDPDAGLDEMQRLLNQATRRNKLLLRRREKKWTQLRKFLYASGLKGLALRMSKAPPELEGERVARFEREKVELG